MQDRIFDVEADKLKCVYRKTPLKMAVKLQSLVKKKFSEIQIKLFFS